MKHLLNNISEEEKNRIREQHEGGMNVAIEKFKSLVETKSGDAKPYLNEMKEDELGEESSNAKQVAGPFSTKPTDIVKYYIYQIGSKFYIYMTNASHKEPTLMDGTAWDNDGKGYSNEMEAKKKIDSVLKDPPHTFLKMKPKMKMMEQNAETLPSRKDIKLGPLNDNEIRELVKQIGECLDDNGKELIYRLNKDKRNHEAFFDMMMAEISRYIDNDGRPGTQG